MNYINQVKALNACSEALDWLRKANHPTLDAAWAACPRGDWMLWLAGRLAGPPGDPSRIPLVLAACDCAALSLPFVVEGEERPRVAIETTRAWARGEAAATEVQAAAAAATAAAAAAAAHNDYAAAAAAAAANAAHAAANIDYAAYAATAAAYAAGPKLFYVTLAQCADIVRRHLPTPPAL